jgi:hypothetical protein
MHLCYCTHIPRKKSSENLAKVVSSNISLEDFGVLQKYAKIYYNYNRLKQPTISHLVRYILNKWASQKRFMEEQNRKQPTKLTKLYVSDPTYRRTHPLSGNKTETTEA